MLFITVAAVFCIAQAVNSVSDCLRYTDLRYGFVSDYTENVKNELRNILKAKISDQDLYINYATLTSDSSGRKATVINTAIHSYEGLGTFYVTFWTNQHSPTVVMKSDVTVYIDDLTTKCRQ